MKVEGQSGKQHSGVLRSATQQVLRPFKWQFTSQFKNVHDKENPALHQQLAAEEDTAAATTALAFPDQNSAQPERSITLDGSLQPGAQKADTNGSSGDMEIQAEAEEEPHRMHFTQVEEHRVTKERVERYVEHNYFQLEYVIKVGSVEYLEGHHNSIPTLLAAEESFALQVQFLAEHKGNQSIQLLSKQRFRGDGRRGGQL